jgi:hypothetical protein
MQKHIGWLWIVGLFGFVVAADAQTASPPAATMQFDGTYAFVSATKVNETYTTRGSEHPGRCPDLPPRTALTIVNGQVRFNQQEGTVGPNGELSTRRIGTPSGKCGDCNVNAATAERPHYGRIDANGTVRVRRMDYYCSWDLIWQRRAQ